MRKAKVKSKLRSMRIAKLKKGKVKGVGLVEGLRLKVLGRIDGANNLPRECDGRWTSPHLDREAKSFSEFSTKMWAHLQIEEEEAYARLNVLMDSIGYTMVQLETDKANLKEALTYPDTFRKHGESKLTDAQVAARRANERAKTLAPLKSRISTLQNKLVAEIDEFSSIRNAIIEDNNSTRMICARVREHLLQRVDVYWNSAMLKHSENARMPVVPSIEVTSKAEAVYMEPHQALMQRAELLCQSLSKEEKEAA